MKLGPTNQFPKGQIAPDDKGELQFAVAADPVKKVVYIKFGTPVDWLALPRPELETFIKALSEKLEQI